MANAESFKWSLRELNSYLKLVIDAKIFETCPTTGRSMPERRWYIYWPGETAEIPEEVALNLLRDPETKPIRRH